MKVFTRKEENDKLKAYSPKEETDYGSSNSYQTGIGKYLYQYKPLKKSKKTDKFVAVSDEPHNNIQLIRRKTINHGKCTYLTLTNRRIHI